MKKYDFLFQKMERTSALISDEISKMLKTEENLPKELHEGLRYTLENSGKRLRPFLCMEVCEYLGGDKTRVLPFSIACEILHNWLLIHDDIQDGDKFRRNKESVWLKFGIGNAINIGDFLAHKVFEVILNAKNELNERQMLNLMSLIVITAKKILEGQVLELELKQRNEFIEIDYISLVNRKTSQLFICAILGGAIVADADKKIFYPLTNYSNDIGVAFQIRDDIIDLTSGKGRKESGSDIKEGKRSILVVSTMSKCSEEEKDLLLKILNKPRDSKTEEDVNYVISLFKKYDTINYAQRKAEEFANKAKSSIETLPSEIKEFLSDIADFAVSRET